MRAPLDRPRRSDEAEWPALFARDLDLISSLGANAVRLHGFFSVTDGGGKHGAFLDMCLERNLSVLLSYDLLGNGERAKVLNTVSGLAAAVDDVRYFVRAAKHPAAVMVFLGEAVNRCARAPCGAASSEGGVGRLEVAGVQNPLIHLALIPPRSHSTSLSLSSPPPPCVCSGDAGFVCPDSGEASLGCQFGEDINAFADALEALCSVVRSEGDIACTAPFASLPLPPGEALSRYGASHVSRGGIG